MSLKVKEIVGTIHKIILTFLYLVDKIAFSILTTFIGRKYTTVVGTDIPTKLVGTEYFDKSCLRPLQSQSTIHFFKAFLNLGKT